jgi:HSP20 family protein
VVAWVVLCFRQFYFLNISQFYQRKMKFSAYSFLLVTFPGLCLAGQKSQPEASELPEKDGSLIRNGVHDDSFIRSMMPLTPVMQVDRFFDDFFPRSLSMSAFPPMPFLRHFDRDASAILRSSSPAYEISEDDDHFQVTLDLPGVAPEECTLSVEDDGRVIRLRCGKKVESENVFAETRFEQSFRLGQYIDPAQISANLADGVMVVNAPKDGLRSGKKSIQVKSEPHSKPFT